MTLKGRGGEGRREKAPSRPVLKKGVLPMCECPPGSTALCHTLGLLFHCWLALSVHFLLQGLGLALGGATRSRRPTVFLLVVWVKEPYPDPQAISHQR